MTPGRRVLLALLSLLVASATLAAPAAAQTEPPDGGAPPSFELVDRPAWVRPEDRVEFLISTEGDATAASVQVEMFSALDSVEELEESASQDVGVRLSLTPRVPVSFLAPGPEGTHVVGLQVSADPVDDFTTQLVEPGVHPVVISLFDGNGTLLDEIRTPVVRLGDEDDPWDAPALAVLLDVEAPPSLQPDGTREIPAPLLERLTHVGEILAAHPDLDLSVSALPDTLDALGTVADPAATTLLERLVDRDVLAAPYVPLPIEAFLRDGLERLVAPLLERGTTVLADRIGDQPRAGAWTGTAEIGDAGGSLLEQLGFDRLVVQPSEDETTPDDGEDEDEDDGSSAEVPLVDSGPRPVDGVGSMLGLVVDPVLSAELASPLDDDADAAHVELARLLLRPTEEDPGGATDDPDDDDPTGDTTVLVRPGPLPARSALAGLLDLLDDPDSPVRVGGLDLVDDRLDEEAAVVEPDLVDIDLGAIAPQANELWSDLDTFSTLTGPGSPRSDDLRLQIATALATTTPDPARVAAITTVDAELRSAFEGVRLSGQTDLNLTSRQGTLPVTIENANGYPVDVVVRLRSDRLAFPEGETLPVTVEEDILRIDVPVEALATGSVPVFVEVWTPDDRVRLDARQLNVRSTAVSGVGLVISLGALLVLVVWWGRNWRSTRRTRHVEPSDEASP